MDEKQDIFPDLIKEALLEMDVPAEELDGTLDMLSFLLIAHL